MHLGACLGRKRVESELAKPRRGVGVCEHHAEHREVADRDLAKRLATEPPSGVSIESDRQISTLSCHTGPDRLGVVTADHIENDIGAMSVGEFHHAVEDIFGEVVDRGRRAEATAIFALRRSPGNRDHVGAQRLAHLYCSGTDATRCPDDKQMLATLEFGTPAQSEIAGVERQQEGRRRCVVEFDRSREHAGRRAHRLFRHATEGAPRHRDDACADPRFGSGASCGDDPAHVHPERERRSHLHLGDPATSTGNVSEVDRRRRHVDQDLVVAERRHVDITHLDDVDWYAQLRCLNRFHGHPQVTDLRARAGLPGTPSTRPTVCCYCRLTSSPT